MQIDQKTVHEELVTALDPTAPSHTTGARWAKHFRQGREDVNHHPQFTPLHHSHLRLKIFN